MTQRRLVVLALAPLVLPFPRTARAAAPDRIVPAVVSAPGAGGGVYRTMLLAHNPSESASRMRLTFHPAGREAAAGDPNVTLELSPGETRTVPDLLRDALALTGTSGSLDVSLVEGALPVLEARVYQETADGGTNGLAVPVVAPSDALQADERAVLLVPGAGRFRFNVGVRTVGGPATLAFTLRDTHGTPRGSVTRSYGADVLVQQSARDVLGVEVRAGDSIVADVVSGSAFLYGTPIDEVTNDGSYQPATRVARASGGGIDLTSDFVPPTGRMGDAREGPGVMRLMTATSADGLTFTRTGITVTDQGDVPDLLVDGKGWVYLYYIGWTVGTEKNKVCVAISRDRGKTWVYKKAVFSGFDGMRDPVDPDVQLLPDGTFRLYVTSGDPAGLARTYYAEGTDGLHFTKKGVAFTPPAGEALDPSTVRIGGTWHLFCGGSPGSNRHATSADGKTYTFLEEKVILKDGVGQLMANGIAVPGGYRFYTFDSMPLVKDGPSRINSVFTTDGVTFAVDAGTRLTLDTTSGRESSTVKDPAAARLDDGTTLLVYATRIP